MIFIHVEFACQYEKVITKPVCVGNYLRINLCAFFAERKNATLCSSANCAADMALCGCQTTSGKNKAAEGGQRGIDAVDFQFKGCHHVGSDDIGGAHFSLAGVGGKVAPYFEEGALDVGKETLVMGVGAVGDEQSDV